MRPFHSFFLPFQLSAFGFPTSDAGSQLASFLYLNERWSLGVIWGHSSLEFQGRPRSFRALKLVNPGKKATWWRYWKSNFDKNYFTFQTYQNVKMVCLKAFIVKKNFIEVIERTSRAIFYKVRYHFVWWTIRYEKHSFQIRDPRIRHSGLGYINAKHKFKTHQNPYGWAKLSSLLCHFGCLLLPENKYETNNKIHERFIWIQ